MHTSARRRRGVEGSRSRRAAPPEEPPIARLPGRKPLRQEEMRRAAQAPPPAPTDACGNRVAGLREGDAQSRPDATPEQPSRRGKADARSTWRASARRRAPSSRQVEPRPNSSRANRWIAHRRRRAARRNPPRWRATAEPPQHLRVPEHAAVGVDLVHDQLRFRKNSFHASCGEDRVGMSGVVSSTRAVPRGSSRRCGGGRRASRPSAGSGSAAKSPRSLPSWSCSRRLQREQRARAARARARRSP
jgi:hypothetical protein